MAARASQKTQILSLEQALDFIERHGVVTESARHSEIPSLADAIAGEPVHGSWWSHPKSRDIFAITRAVRDAPQVLVCRLVDGKITYVHERLWPALVRVADRFSPKQLACVHEVHSASGKHVIEEMPFPEWVPAKVNTPAKQLTEAAAMKALEMLLR